MASLSVPSKRFQELFQKSQELNATSQELLLKQSMAHRYQTIKLLNMLPWSKTWNKHNKQRVANFNSQNVATAAILARFSSLRSELLRSSVLARRPLDAGP